MLFEFWYTNNTLLDIMPFFFFALIPLKLSIFAYIEMDYIYIYIYEVRYCSDVGK